MAYQQDLLSAGLHAGAIRTYVDRASRFVRWLDGEFVTSGPRKSQHPSTDHEGTNQTADLAWAREDSVQKTVAAWLRKSGWTIEHEADTQSGQHGVDILATRGSERLAIEVKGYPQPVYTKGQKIGQPRRWHPGAQARTYFGNAIHAALVMRDSLPGSQIALAFPYVGGYPDLLEQVRRSLADLQVRCFLVRRGGRVLEPYAGGAVLPSQGARRVTSASNRDRAGW